MFGTYIFILFLVLLPGLISYCYCNKLPWTWWLKTPSHSRTILEVRNPRMKMLVGQHSFWRLQGENQLPCLSSFHRHPHSFLHLQSQQHLLISPPTSASTVHLLLTLLIWTLVMTLGAPDNPGSSPQVETLKVITSVASFFARLGHGHLWRTIILSTTLLFNLK